MSWLSEVTADEPSAWFRHGEAAGTEGIDAIGGTAGTYSGGFTLGVPGLVASDADTAVDLNGTTGKMLVASRAALDLGDVFSLEAWIKFDTGSRRNTIIAKGANAYLLRVHENNKLLFGRDGVAVLAESTVELKTGTVYHVVATKNGTTRKLYLDSVDVTSLSTNSTCTNNASTLSVGAYAAGTEYFFDGILDEVALYKKELSAARVKAHYEAGIATGPRPGSRSLLGVGR